jgi:cell division septum initiation protein DivIVA
MPRGKRRLGGHELVEQLNAAVAQLIRENRKLKRQVEKMSARATSSASGAVDRGLRGIQRRVTKALTTTTRRRRRRVTAAAAAKKTTRKKRTPKAAA